MDRRKKRNLSEVAADYVREQILQGKLAQREKLVENDIAVTLGMSRGPVRDALKQLMYEGFLDYEPIKGTLSPCFTQGRPMRYSFCGATWKTWLWSGAGPSPERQHFSHGGRGAGHEGGCGRGRHGENHPV